MVIFNVWMFDNNDVGTVVNNLCVVWSEVSVKLCSLYNSPIASSYLPSINHEINAHLLMSRSNSGILGLEKGDEGG